MTDERPVSDALEQFVEVVDDTGHALEPLVVEREPFDKILAQSGGRPLAELGPPRTADAVADGEDHLQIVVVDQPLDLPDALGLNY